ncbi:MAG: zf-HC2 domain-containing protein [Pyrinomonadaceae bacterium]
MDSLLRRGTRGTAESRLWGEGAGDGVTGAHLDADEMGAFAEGALPAAARVAVASHLADCERCRGVVVGLARVAGFEVKEQAVAIPASAESARPSAWRAFVTSLFAPRMLRYATPVLALSLVAVVTYVALRSNNSANVRMARQERAQTSTAIKEPTAPTTTNDSAANANIGGLVAQNSNAAPHEEQGAGASPAQTRGHGGTEAQPGDVAADKAEAQPPSTATTAAPPPPPPAAAADELSTLSKAAPKTATTEEGEAAKADNNKEKSENRDKSVRGAEPGDDVASNDAIAQRSRSRMNQVQMPDGGTSNQKRAADNNASGNSGNAAGAGSTTAPPKESDRERAGTRSEVASRARAPKQAERKDEDEREGQTRTAGGHRFRREGSKWVDVNYKSSMPSTGVHRGTESFRALVADVPEVGRVAEAIGGEVIVVVGGHAYTIR